MPRWGPGQPAGYSSILPILIYFILVSFFSWSALCLADTNEEGARVVTHSQPSSPSAPPIHQIRRLARGRQERSLVGVSCIHQNYVRTRGEMLEQFDLLSIHTQWS